MSEGKSQLNNLCYLVRFWTDLSTVMHQIHCVGVLWFFAHRNEWDFRTILNKSEDFMKIHARHCNVLLFNMIRCMSDVTPVLFQQDRGNSISGSGLGEWKTRDAPRRCKRFDKLWDWEQENRICPMACEPEDIAALYPETSLTKWYFFLTCDPSFWVWLPVHWSNVSRSEWVPLFPLYQNFTTYPLLRSTIKNVEGLTMNKYPFLKVQPEGLNTASSSRT